MKDKDTLVRQLAEEIYKDFDLSLMDVEFIVSDLADCCAKNQTAFEQFNDLVTLVRQQPHEHEKEDSDG